MKKILTTCLCIVFSLMSTLVWATPINGSSTTPENPATPEVTSAIVYQQAQLIVADLHQIRNMQGLDDFTPLVKVPEVRLPMHVYAKSLEVLAKTNELARKNNVPTDALPGFPDHEVTQEDIEANLQTVLKLLDKVKIRLGVSATVTPKPVDPSKTSVDVYRELWVASKMLEELTDTISADEVYRNSQMIIVNLQNIAKKLGVTVEKNGLPFRPVSTLPQRVNFEVSKLLDNVVKLQQQLGIETVKPDIQSGVTATDVFDSSLTVLAHIAQIENHLGIPFEENVPSYTQKQPADALVQMEIANTIVKQLLKAEIKVPAPDPEKQDPVEH